jgi:hypothetical protein
LSCERRYDPDIGIAQIAPFARTLGSQGGRAALSFTDKYRRWAVIDPLCAFVQRNTSQIGNCGNQRVSDLAHFGRGTQFGIYYMLRRRLSP